MPGCDDPQYGIQNLARASRAITNITQRVAPGLTLVQIRKEALKRPDKRPQATDAYGAGQIVHNSTLLLALYRADKYVELPEDRKNQPRPAELLVRKNRNGEEGGTIKLIYIPYLTKWVEV